MLTGWVGGRGAAVALLPAVTLSTVADTDAAPVAAGEGCTGFSLPELLAALAAYSVLLTVALHLFRTAPWCRRSDTAAEIDAPA